MLPMKRAKARGVGSCRIWDLQEEWCPEDLLAVEQAGKEGEGSLQRNRNGSVLFYMWVDPLITQFALYSSTKSIPQVPGGIYSACAWLRGCETHHSLLCVNERISGGSHTSPCRTHPSWDHTLSMWRRIPSTIGARVASRSPSPGATTWAAPGPSSSRWWWFRSTRGSSGFVAASTALAGRTSTAHAGLYGWMWIPSRQRACFLEAASWPGWSSLGWPIHERQRRNPIEGGERSRFQNSATFGNIFRLLDDCA